jgi:hypothetical protein
MPILDSWLYDSHEWSLHEPILIDLFNLGDKTNKGNYQYLWI